MGRAFSNNLISQGLYEAYREAFWEMGLDFDKITDEENDAGLGNGGLGRLAACFGFTFYDGTSSTRMWDPI